MIRDLVVARKFLQRIPGIFVDVDARNRRSCSRRNSISPG